MPLFYLEETEDAWKQLKQGFLQTSFRTPLQVTNPKPFSISDKSCCSDFAQKFARF